MRQCDECTHAPVKHMNVSMPAPIANDAAPIFTRKRRKSFIRCRGWALRPDLPLEDARPSFLAVTVSGLRSPEEVAAPASPGGQGALGLALNGMIIMPAGAAH